jgi:hypothetical protein
MAVVMVMVMVVENMVQNVTESGKQDKSPEIKGVVHPPGKQPYETAEDVISVVDAERGVEESKASSAIACSNEVPATPTVVHPRTVEAPMTSEERGNKTVLAPAKEIECILNLVADISQIGMSGGRKDVRRKGLRSLPCLSGAFRPAAKAIEQAPRIEKETRRKG